MECIPRLTHRLLPIPIPIPITQICFTTRFLSHPPTTFQQTRNPISRPDNSQLIHAFNSITFPLASKRTHSSSATARAGWLGGFGKKAPKLPNITKAGDPVLHEPAQEVQPEDIGSDRIKQIIDDMIKAMRDAPGVGLAAPQIGVSLRMIVLEDTKEFVSYAPKEVLEAQDRRPFDLLVIINPKLKKKGKKTALFFEGCLSVDGFRAVVERHLEVEVTGLDQNGEPIKIEASGWQARILQHECDHLDGILYVDKMIPRTFRTAQNLDLPLATGCPNLGVRNIR